MKNKKRLICVISICVVIFLAIIVVLAFVPRTVNMKKFVNARVTGVSGKGQLEYQLEDRFFPEELGMKITANKTKNISNGDVIKFKITYNKMKCNEYGIKPKNTNLSFKINNLADYSKSEGETTQAHYFYASTDMNDEIAKPVLDKMYSVIMDELSFINHDVKPKISESGILGIYADKDTGEGDSIVAKFVVTNDTMTNKTIYVCFSFSGLDNYIVGSNIKTLELEYMDALEYKTDSYIGISTFYEDSLQGVNKAMAEDNFELIKYEYNRK